MSRIVSFLPSATETLYELGVETKIVGVTHECNFPSGAKRKLRVIRCSFEPRGMSSAEIDRKIVKLMHSGKDIYVVDEQSLKKANPDLIVAQGLCEVCSPFTKEINRSLALLDNKPDVLVLDPHNLDDILENIMEVSKRVRRARKGRRLVSSLQKRIDTIRHEVVKIERAANTSKMHHTPPKVVCLEWIDPIFTAGHWVPQMVEIAGGISGLSSTGEPARRIDIQEVANFDPDIIVLMPCGFDVNRTLKELVPLSNSDLKALRAVKKGDVYAVDAGSYFSKPGPRTVTGLEILARILHPQSLKYLKVPRNSFKRVN